MASQNQNSELLTGVNSGLVNRLTSLRNAAARACTSVIPPEMERIYTDALLDAADLRTPPPSEIVVENVDAREEEEEVDDPARPRPQVEHFVDMERITRIEDWNPELYVEDTNTTLAIGTFETLTVDFDDEESMADLALGVQGLSDYRVHMTDEQRLAFRNTVYGHFIYIDSVLHCASLEEMIYVIHTSLPSFAHHYFVYGAELLMVIGTRSNHRVVDCVIAQPLEYALYVLDDEITDPTLEYRGHISTQEIPFSRFMDSLSASRQNANLPAFTANHVRTLFLHYL